MSVEGHSSTAELAPEGLFIRKSSGLIRELGTLEAFGMNLAGVQPSGIMIVYFVILAAYPGADLTLPLIITFVAALLLTLMYSQLVATMPRSGADFIYIGRILNPLMGSTVGIALLFILLVGTTGVGGILLATIFLPFTFHTLDTVFGAPGLGHFADTSLISKTGTIVCQAILLAVATALLMTRVRVIARAAFWTAMLAWVAALLLMIEFILHGRSDFKAAFDAHVHNPHAYDQLITAAEKAGLSTGVHWTPTIEAIGLASVLWLGLIIANTTGGELRRAGTTFRNSSLLALGIYAFPCIGMWLVMRHSVGLQFSQAAAYLSTNDPTQYGKIAGDVSAFAPALALQADSVIKVIIAVGAASGLVSLIFAGTLILTRLEFALAFDRILPAVVARVNPKSHAPVYAALLAAGLSLAYAISYVEFSTLGSLFRNLAIVTYGIYALSSFAAAILPWRRKDLYDVAPKVVGRQLFGLPAITVIGGISCLAQLALLVFVATQSQVSGGYDTTSIVTLVVACGLGAVIYVATWYRLRARGLDLGVAMHELPPE